MLNTSSEFEYKPFLKEVYLDPIRTVTVIDDEYPTIDELLTNNRDISNNKNQYLEADTERLLEAFSTCRKKEHNWMLDIHNGKEDSFEGELVASRLHHSDLLILDYHLDGEDEGSCQQALDILKYLAHNKNFNLVAVHTKGYTSAKGNANDVFLDVVCSLQIKPKNFNLHEKAVTLVEAHIDDWDIDSSNIRKRLIDSISNIDLLKTILESKKSNSTELINLDVFSEFRELFNNKSKDIELSESLLLKWLLHIKVDSLSSRFGNIEYTHFDWNFETECNWIKTDDLFVTVLGKHGTSISDIPDKILDALNDWTPHPHKLVLTKLRHEIDKNGISAAQNILNKELLQAAWFESLLLSEDNIDIGSWDIIQRLLEELTYEIKDPLIEFVTKLSKDLHKANQQGNISSKFIRNDILEKKLLQKAHSNSFNCSKRIDGSHLTTGHILNINDNYWLCLTPMCDLVPNQKKLGYGDFMPVTLVQLYDAKSAWTLSRSNLSKTINKILPSSSNIDLPPLKDSELLNQIMDRASENNLLFLKLNDDENEISFFSFTATLDGKSNPKSKEFLINNQGVFNPSKEFSLFSSELCISNNIPIMAQCRAKVVAELRYEYALNLLQKLGFSKSRVGLDFA